MAFTTERAKTLHVLLAQVQGAVAFLEEVLDEDFPGWDQPRTGRSRDPAGGSAPRCAYGQLSIAWINLAHMLSREPGIQAWDVEPFISRRHDGQGMSRWEFGPDGLELSVQESVRLEWRNVPQGAVRFVETPEPRYTLEQARELLKGCERHSWVVELDDDGLPSAVVCERPGCDARRETEAG